MAKGPNRDLAKEKRWRGLVARQEKSGRSIREFCDREGVDLGRFYDWRQKLRRRGSESGPKEDVFVPIKLREVDLGQPGWAMEIELGDVVKVRVGARADLAALMGTLRALGIKGC